MIPPSAQPVARHHAILRYPDLSSPIAIDGAGTIVAASQFLADAGFVAARLPDGDYVVNLCSDRYRFTVGFFAALLRRQITLLPSSEADAPLAALLETYPNTYFLTDGKDTGVRTSRVFRFPEAPVPAQSDIIPSVPGDQIAAILFTSGSTGTPKPHARSWGAIVNSAHGAGRALGLESGTSAFVLGTVPHQHSYGLESIVVLALQNGFAFHRGRALLPGDIALQLDRLPQPRILVTTPVHLRGLTALDRQLPPLDRIICATAPLTDRLAHAAEMRFAAPLFEIYGCTEVGQMAVRRTTESAAWRCVEGISLDERNGEVWASGEAAAASAPVGDHVDLIDAKRFLLRDRRSDVVNIAGKRSSLGYLNHHLNAIDGVHDGAFVMPSDDRRLAAYVVAPDLSAKQILDSLRPSVESAFLPRPIHFVDRLPRDAVGKLTRQALATLCDEKGWSARDYRFTPDHPTGPGHFPGNPIIPGALLLDRVLDAMGRADTEKQQVRFAKFLRPVRPGDAVVFRWRESGRQIAFECVLSGGDEVALTGSVALEAV